MEECEDVSAIDGALPGPQLQEDMVTSEVNPFLLLESRIKPILHKSRMLIQKSKLEWILESFIFKT